MPMIRPSADLRNRYLEISEYCHNQGQPVFITRNGSGDLAVMSIELYEKLTSRQELYATVEKGIDDETAVRTSPATDVIRRAREKNLL